MADFIERGDAFDAVMGQFCACSDETEAALNGAIEDIRKIPAADVRPVVRGRWIKAKRGWYTPGGDPVWECSECGKGMHVFGVEHGSYGSDVADGQWVACPNCGADMRDFARDTNVPDKDAGKMEE